LCQGTLWEITSVPEIVRQADAAAVASVSSLDFPGSGAGEKIWSGPEPEDARQTGPQLREYSDLSFGHAGGACSRPSVALGSGWGIKSND
jgi:hypothetical protein